MDISDIPNQIGKALKYSLRSPSHFVISLVTSMAVLAVAYDVVYGFAYVRWCNVKDPHYDGRYAVGLLLTAIVLPMVAGVTAFFRARYQARRFGPTELGIAIAPFEVFTVDPETLGTANVLQALDIVGTEFFRLVQSTMSEFPWARNFTFRFLPQFVRIKSKSEAEKQRASLDATVLAWGVITQRSRQPLEIRLEMQGAVKRYTFSQLSVEEFPIRVLQTFALIEGAQTVSDRGDGAHARQLFEQALPLGTEIDSKHPGAGVVARIEAALQTLPASGGTGV